MTMTNKERAERRESALQFIQNGGTLREAAKKFGLSEGYLRNFLKRPHKDRHDKIAEFLNEGGSINEACKEFYVGYGMVRDVMRKYGISKQRSTSLTIKTYQIIAELLNTTKSYREIGKAFGISGQRVHQIYQTACTAGIKFPLRE